MDITGKPAMAAKPPDNKTKRGRKAEGVRASSSVGSEMSSPDHLSSTEGSPQHDYSVDKYTQAEEIDVNPEEAPREHPAERAVPLHEEQVLESEDDEEEEDHNVNYPRRPKKSKLPPRLTGKSKYVKENPDPENLFKFLLASFVVVFRGIELDTFGLSFPKTEDDEKLGLENIVGLFPELANHQCKVTNFLKDSTEMINFKQLIEKINKGGKEGHNCLDCEISKKPILNRKVDMPFRVIPQSMVSELRKLFEKRLEDITKELRSKGKSDVKKALNGEKDELDRVLKLLPAYEKFFIFSMEKAFTNLHVDLGGTYVYYYVLEGTKVFWIAPPTKKNFEIYKELEKNRKNIWEEKEHEEFLKNNFERHELHAGDFAFIPSGWLHFVYTPCKSLVFGGNFLNKNNLKRHFEITRFEEECRIKDNEKFKHFWDVQFAYVKYIWMKDAQVNFEHDQSTLSKELLEKGQLFLDELEQEECKNGDIYSDTQRKEIVKKLRAAINKGTPKYTKKQKAQQEQESKTESEYIESSTYLESIEREEKLIEEIADPSKRKTAQLNLYNNIHDLVELLDREDLKKIAFDDPSVPSCSNAKRQKLE